MESFNGKLRDELLNVEIFDTLWEAKVPVLDPRGWLTGIPSGREYNEAE